jgi:hypothetical protein
MFKLRWQQTILPLVFLSLSWVGSQTLAQNHSLSVSQGVLANPGEKGVPLYLVMSSVDSIAGFEAFLDFNPELLTAAGVVAASRFQVFGYHLFSSGQVKIIARRQSADSVYIGPLGPGLDTLACVYMSVTSQDLLVDVETAVEFSEYQQIPYSDNILVAPDSSFIEPPDLGLTHGSVFIRYPLYGDINDDGRPDTIADAIFFLNFLAGRQRLTPRQRANSDVTRDGAQAGMADFIRLVTIITEN